MKPLVWQVSRWKEPSHVPRRRIPIAENNVRETLVASMKLLLVEDNLEFALWLSKAL